jgi:hypothetical protein
MNRQIVWRENSITEAMRLHAAYEQEYADELAIARASADDEEDEANEESEFVRSIRPVNLESDRNAEYEGFFYPSDRQFLVAILESLSDVTSNINLFFRFMRACMADANYISGMDEQAAKDRVERLFYDTMQRKRDEASVKSAVVGFLRAIRMSQSAFHNIYRSKRYNNGIDIVLNGTGTDVRADHVPAPYFGTDDANMGQGDLLANNGAQHYFVESHRRGRWQSPFGENILAAAKEITIFLFGSAAISERVMHRGLSVNTKFTDIEDIWTKHTGFKLPKSIITDMDVTNHLAEQFLQVEVMKMPSEKAVEAAADARNQARMGEAAANNSMVETILNSGTAKLAPEAELMNLVLRTSIRFTLESDIAHYVSQTEDSERPNLSRTNAWFSVYIGQVIRAKVAQTRKGVPSYSNERAIKMVNIPRYSMGASTLKKISDIRTQHGFVVEKTKGNSENMYIRPNGTMAVRPDIESFKNSTLANDYEKVSEEILEILDRNDIPIAGFNGDPRPEKWPHIDMHDVQRLNDLMTELKSFDGCIIGYDWDFGITMTAGDMPGSATTRVDVGSVTPDSLSIADYLGYNLSKEGEKPMVRNFASTMWVLTKYQNLSEIGYKSERAYGSKTAASTFANSDIVTDIVDVYLKLAYADNKAPKLEAIAKAAIRALGYEKLPTEKGHDYSTTYFEYFNEDGSFKASQVSMTKRAISSILGAAMTQASGEQGSQLWTETFNDMRTDDYSPKSFEVQEELSAHPNYFNASTSTTADFAKLYNYFGGQVFKQILDAINAIPAGDYFNERGGRLQIAVGQNPNNPDVEYKLDIPKLNNRRIMHDVLPFTTMLGKYAPNQETIFAEADEQVESIRPDESFSSEDIKVPGMVTDSPRAVFPHQASVQSYLRKKVPPSFAILALDPGGGKTGQGVIDMTCMVKDMLEAGTVVKPLVICPNGLINQWCEDMKYFVGENWNPFPLSADVMKRWGEKRLLEVATAAPPNTIFIASMTFIQGRNKRVCIGNAQVNFSANLEFIRRLGCNYIAIDESHNLKSFNSARHRATKILTTSTMVKWLRILTGTIMPDRAKDIEGQIALKTPHVFRAGEIANIRSDAEASGSDVKIGDRVVATYTPLNGKRAVDKLSHYTAFIVKKRKEWAFMLPAPIETFHAIALVDKDGNDGTSLEEIEQQKLHEQLYKLVLDKTLEDLKPLLAQKKKAEDAADHDYDEEGEGEHGSQEENEGGGGVGLIDNDADFAGEKIKQALWEKNLARFERLIIAPQYDEAYEEVFGKGAVFKSRKAKYIANLVHLHFNTPAWRRGQQYTEYDLVSVGKDLYVAKKYHSSAEHMALPRDQLNTSPEENPDYWKKEPRGKLIIITRYNHSASAIFDALPENYKQKAVKFTGDEPDKVKSFNDFKTDDRVQILIANEQGMSEGHNLQMASRIIRAESPWGPGALNQTNARIFRPDPKGAIAAAKGEGEMTRDVIYLDWVLANNTMEVPKQARVISKTFGIARFTEADNPRYKEMLTRRKVPTERENAALSLGIDMLKNIKGLNDEPFRGMRESYEELNEIENKEFRDMRAEQEAKLLPIEASPNVAGARQMDVRPFVPNMPVADPNKWKLTNVEILLRDEKIANDFVEHLSKKPVLTEWGTGKIVGFNKKDGGKRLSSLIVNLKNPPAGMPSRVTIQPNMCYVAMENITPDQESKYFDVSTAGTDTEEKRQEARDKRLEKQQKAQEEQEEKERRIRERQQKETIGIIKKEQADGEKRKDNEAKGKPLNDGIYKVKDAVIKIAPTGKKVIATDDAEPDIGRIVPVDSDLDVWLSPAYYHGFATLEAEFDEGDVNLKSLGFQWTPSYAFVTVSNKKKFHAIYEYLDSNFDLPDKTVDLIQEINAAFEPGLKNTHKLWYSLELAPVSELPAFFSVGKRVTSNRRAIRVFPIFMEDHVMLCVDIRTNPAIVKHIGKTITGAGVKWQKSEGQWLFFGKNKTDLKDMISKVGKAGYTVVNKAAALKELAELKFRYKKTK